MKRTALLLAALAEGLKRSGKSLRRAATEPAAKQRINTLLMQTEQDAISDTQPAAARVAECRSAARRRLQRPAAGQRRRRHSTSHNFR